MYYHCINGWNCWITSCIVRFFTVPKVKDARSSAGWALVFIALLYTTAPAVSVMARYNLINTVHPEITDTEITSLAMTKDQSG